jgi:hypothetical protein
MMRCFFFVKFFGKDQQNWHQFCLLHRNRVAPQFVYIKNNYYNQELYMKKDYKIKLFRIEKK